MNMRMVLQSLSPTVQDGQDSDLCPQALGISRNGTDRFRDRPEQNAVDDLLVLVGNRGDLCRQAEDNVKILDRQEVALTVLQPPLLGQALALWAMAVAAGGLTDAHVPAPLTLLRMAAQGSRAAHLDRPHHTQLLIGERAVMRRTVSRANLAENIRHLQRRSRHGALLLKGGQ